MNGRDERENHHGITLFLLLAAVIGIIAVIAAGITGPLGIEERFAAAVGQQPDGTVHNDGGNGLSIEGNTLVYGAFLVILILVCIFAFRRYRL